MEFDLFKPSGKILEKICEDKKKFVYTYLVIPRKFADEPMEYLVRAYHPALGNFVGSFYNLGEFVKESPHLESKLIYKFNYRQFLGVFREGTTNAIAHCPENCSQINYGLFLGDKGILHGFRNFGDYFKSEKTKKLWESKTPVQSTRESNFSGHGAGDKIIYSLSDFIKVDSKKGILYCGQTHERLEINPGKFYFYEDK